MYHLPPIISMPYSPPRSRRAQSYDKRDKTGQIHNTEETYTASPVAGRDTPFPPPSPPPPRDYSETINRKAGAVWR